MKYILTKHKCKDKKCRGRIKMTVLEQHYVCKKCNEDYGYHWEEDKNGLHNK